MNIVKIARKARKKGFLDLSMELALERALEQPVLEAEEYEALVKLERAIRKGKVHTVGRRSCVNVMEQVVWREIMQRVDEGTLPPDGEVDLGDIAAHALSRLPARYATTDEGLTHALEAIRGEMMEQVSEAIIESIKECGGSAEYHKDRAPIKTAESGIDMRGSILRWQSKVGGM